MEFTDSRRVPRHPFIADIEATNMKSGIQITEHTKELSLFGCGVETRKLIPRGTDVKVTITHEGAEMKALGRVVYARPDIGMGIAFTSVEPESERILRGWIAELASIEVQKQ